MYTLSDAISAIKQPRLIAEEFNRIYNQGYNFRDHPAHNPSGVEILSEDWDNLIILDACRYDSFKKAYTLGEDEQLKKVESKSSSTINFLRANFSGNSLRDTVYVTANPQLYRITENIYDVDSIDINFHDTINVWQDGWHEEHRTVMPEVVSEAALEAKERYPQKRIITHFLQPHAPYVGETGKEKTPTNYLNFWNSYRDGEFNLSLDTAKQAYYENLELALPHVSKLLNEFVGKTIVTADHGELLGERDSPIPIRRYGHPPYTNMSPLLEVPWLISDNGSRPNIVSEESTQPSSTEATAQKVKQRLEDLGYTE